MLNLHNFFRLAITLIVASFCAAATQAQTVVYISAKTGADGNACTLAAPCRSLVFAHGAVAANGRVVILDSGDYSNLQITKSITIEAAPGAVPVISNAAANPMLQVLATANDKVILRGLHLKGLSATNAVGIAMNFGGTLLLDRCVIEGFANSGIISSSAGTITLSNSSVRNNDTGVSLANVTNPGTLFATIENCLIERNSFTGIDLSPSSNSNVRAVIRNTRVSHNSGVGIRAIADPTNSGIDCLLENVIVVGNATGIHAERSPVEVFVAKSTIVNNTTGLSRASLANIFTDTTNTVEGNNTNGTFSEIFGHQ